MRNKKNKFSIETKYKGYQMRSRLEARTAFLLDQLNIEWEYEKDKIKLSSGDIYIPDFYLPNKEKWLECKGDLKDPSMSKPKNLVKEKSEEVMVFSQEQARYYTTQRGRKGKVVTAGEEINLIKCSSCNNYSFVPNIGSWHCRSCGDHRGNEDIVKYSIFKGSWFDGLPDLEIQSFEEVEEFFFKV